MARKAAVLETERNQAERERLAAAQRLVEIERSLEEAAVEREAGSRRLAALGAAVADVRAALETAQVRSSEAKSRLAALRERVAAAEAEGQRLARDHAELRQRITGAHGRGAEMQTRRQQLGDERAECERALAEALGERDRVAGEVAVAEDGVRDIRNELEGREQALKERRREREMLRDALSELEVAQARNGSDLDHLARECHQAVGRTAAEAAAQLSEGDRDRDRALLEAQVQELREKLERMGAVNVLAVEQAQELDERHTFLVAQRQDLLE